jgi:glycosyltransferase involved in cell wall biosynthesis
MIGDSTAGLAPKPWSRRIWYPASRLSQVGAAARLADRLIVLNETDRQFAIASRWLPPDRIDVVTHGVSERFLGSYCAAAPRGAGALFCGAWDRVKGTPYLVDAFQLLAEQGRPVPLTILGCGIPPAAVLASLPESLRPHVTIVDRVSEDEVVAQYRRHDLLVFPSTYEGFGLVVLEAMSQGLPVIATPVGCVPDLIRDRETGIVVPLRDSSALAEAVTSLMASPATRARLGAAAVAAVAPMSWRRTAERTIEVYVKARGRR